jgi:nucleoside-triphosphatase THEP1
MGPRIMLLFGQQNEGKTTKLLEIYRELNKMEIESVGFVAPGVWHNGQKTGYQLLELPSLLSVPLASIIADQNSVQHGRFYFNQATIDHGNQLILDAIKTKPAMFFIDEIGRFELEGHIWHDSFHLLTQCKNMTLIVGVREQYLVGVKEKFKLQGTIDFHISTDINIIIKCLQKTASLGNMD